MLSPEAMAAALASSDPTKRLEAQVRMAALAKALGQPQVEQHYTQEALKIAKNPETNNSNQQSKTSASKPKV